MVITSIGRTSRLVDRFKTTAVEQNEETKSSFKLESLLQNIVSSYAGRLQEHQHTIAIDFHKSLEINSYPVALTLIVSNLINNSLTHGFANRQGGHITLAISESKYSETDNILIEFHDDGIGIKEEDRTKVFDPFFTTNMGENSGLGLHIVHNLVTNQFGGTIRCETRINDERLGAHFYITLPRGG